MKKLIYLLARDCLEQKNLNDFRDMIVAIDTFIFIYKSILDYRNFSGGKDKLNIHGEIVTHLEYIFDKIVKLKRYNITSLWIFDGKPPEIKREELAKRRAKKQEIQKAYESSNSYDPEKPVHSRNFTINKTILKNLYTMLNLMGIPYVTADGEADYLGAFLNKNAVVDALITEDWDALPFGCQNLIKNFGSKQELYTVNVSKLLEALELTQEQFVDLCILLGTDYCPSITGLSGLKAYYMYYEFKDMEMLVNHLNIVNANCKEVKYVIPENFIERWRNAKEYYLNTLTLTTTTQTKQFFWRKPQKKKLIDFLCDECQFDRERTIERVEKLMEMYYFQLYKNRYHKKIYNYNNAMRQQNVISSSL